jgi:hypothetical protein
MVHNSSYSKITTFTAMKDQQLSLLSQLFPKKLLMQQERDGFDIILLFQDRHFYSKNARSIIITFKPIVSKEVTYATRARRL